MTRRFCEMADCNNPATVQGDQWWFCDLCLAKHEEVMADDLGEQPRTGPKPGRPVFVRGNSYIACDHPGCTRLADGGVDGGVWFCSPHWRTHRFVQLAQHGVREECGSVRGYDRHRRRHEAICNDCRLAAKAHRRANRLGLTGGDAA